MSLQILARVQRQLQQLHADVDRLNSAIPDTEQQQLQGRIAASLGTLDRNMKDLREWTVSREMNIGRRTEAKERLVRLEEEQSEIRRALDRRRSQVKRQEALERDLLFTPTAASSPSTSNFNRPGSAPPSYLVTGTGSVSPTPEVHLRMDQSLQRSLRQVDEYLQMGQASFEQLRQQGNLLKSAQRRVLDVANTLGLSTTTLRWIERRTTEDKYIFWAGVVVTLLVLYFAFVWLGIV